MGDALPALYRASENAAAGAIGDEVALLDFGTDAYYTLNATGAFVWRLLAVPSSLDDMALAVAAEYDLPVDVAISDVRDLVADLVRSGLVGAMVP